MTPEHAETAKSLGDALSITVAVGTLVNLLPSIAALLTIIWTVIRIIETDTVRGLIARFRRKQ